MSNAQVDGRQEMYSHRDYLRAVLESGVTSLSLCHSRFSSFLHVKCQVPSTTIHLPSDMTKMSECLRSSTRYFSVNLQMAMVRIPILMVTVPSVRSDLQLISNR